MTFQIQLVNIFHNFPSKYLPYPQNITVKFLSLLPGILWVSHIIAEIKAIVQMHVSIHSKCYFPIQCKKVFTNILVFNQNKYDRDAGWEINVLTKQRMLLISTYPLTLGQSFFFSSSRGSRDLAGENCYNSLTVCKWPLRRNGSFHSLRYLKLILE